LAQQAPSFIKDSLGSYITRAMSKWKIPGLSIAIVQGDSIVYVKGFGRTSICSGEQVTGQTLFPIWSMGKSFTAFSLALLQEQGRLKLDDPVSKHLPSFQMADQQQQKDATIIDLLAHRLGVETFQGDFLWSESTLSTTELLKRWAMIPAAHGIRTGFHYSNFGYLIAGELIREVSQYSWQQFMLDSVLLPLQMRSTCVYVDSAYRSMHRARGHTLVQGKPSPLPLASGKFISAFGGMYSNAQDMASWLMVNMNNGMVNGRRIFSEQAFRAVHTPQNIIGRTYLPNGSQSILNYALGWDIRSYSGVEVLSHGGAYAGHLSMMAIVPEKKLGVVILTNSDAHGLIEALQWQVIDAYLGKPFMHYSDSIYQYVERGLTWEADQLAQQKSSLTKADAIDQNIYTGTYHCPVYGDAYISSLQGKLTLRFQHHPNLEALLQPLSATRFVCKYNHPMFGEVIIPFAFDGGKVNGFTLSVHPSVEFTSYDFRKL
jgi:CubicO group peptidase (beta-lactamase class C family)